MATSSIFDTVKMNDPKDLEAFVMAAEESERLSRSVPQSQVSMRMATRDDTKRLHEMRRKKREALG